MPELWFDVRNYDSAKLKTDIVIKTEIETGRRKAFPSMTNNGVVYHRYDFSIIPDFGFLASAEPLAKNIELKLSFDRELAKMSVLEYIEGGDDSILEKPWVIGDCHSIAEYVSSPDLRSQYETIQHAPLVYNYDESEVVIRTLPLNETTIRLDAIHGGPVPTYMFAGVIPTESLQGSKTKTCTGFQQNNVTEFAININGHSVNGYPVKSEVGACTYPFLKWLDSTNRLHNNMTGQSFTLENFKDNFIWSHHFEIEETSSGWISINMKLKEGFTENMSLVIWLISPFTLSLDKFNQIEKIKV